MINFHQDAGLHVLEPRRSLVLPRTTMIIARCCKQTGTGDACTRLTWSIRRQAAATFRGVGDATANNFTAEINSGSSTKGEKIEPCV